MSIPSHCTVLVVGGGPGGSYAATVLAREGIDTVLLEAAVFPRYHVGESMLASIRHLLRFIDLDSTFDNHGFTKKVGAAFKLHPEQREGYTDFLAAGRSENYAWNVIRSEADNLLFQHARRSGAQAYDGVKVHDITFTHAASTVRNSFMDRGVVSSGPPVSASYKCVSDGTSGTINFKYLIDASGRAGLLNTKYSKTRNYNEGLNNVAYWGYWKGAAAYAQGTERANSPYFEALRDGSGWVWLIPLHDGTTSVGVVMNQDIAKSKRTQSSSTEDLYRSSISLASSIQSLLAGGELTSRLHSASDYSYSSSSYASPYTRTVGDAGCFIDPYFSSGVHLAMVSALSAATTICAVIKGDCEEEVAAQWHSTKVADGYTRFLLVVLSAYKQIRNQNESVLNDLGEDNLDKAFEHFKPIIQGTADVSNKISQAELSETVQFCSNAWGGTQPEARSAMFRKMQSAVDGADSVQRDARLKKMQDGLSAEENRVMDYIRARQLLRTEDSMHIDNFSTDVINGLAPNVKREASILALRRDPRLLKVPPYLSTVCILVGIFWLCLLPLNEYSRHTYISENALLPGQVHTYLGGSEQHVFNAYKHEVQALAGTNHDEIAAKLCEIFRSVGLKAATQKYEYQAAGHTVAGENAYAILHAPRGDATEAIVLVAAWTNMDGDINQSGVALAMTLARYFKRWSLWSKDIIILITSDSKAGPQAWVDAYHDEHSSLSAAPLPLKSGALQGVVVLDHALDHRFESIHVIYDGINGQLPNLDLFNSAVHIVNGQMGIGVSLQRMWKHDDSYRDRLQTMLRGMVSQGLGHTSGSHSSFIPYHVDAITLQAVGNGWHDEMALGRCVEGTFRSLNNLLEHFHQSFFFYLLMQSQRFVSIGTYLPSAMLVAVNFTIMAIALWIQSGRPLKPAMAPTAGDKPRKLEAEVIEHDGMVAVVPKQELATVERKLFLPVVLVVAFHFLGAVPLYIFNNTHQDILPQTLTFSALANVFLPTLLAILISGYTNLSTHRLVLLHCFSLLLLGMFLATLATLNFSLAFLVGLLAAPLSFVGIPMAAENGDGAPKLSVRRQVVCNAVLHLLSPPVVVWAVCKVLGVDAGTVLAEAAFGWKVSGLWTQVVVCCVWWPAWMVAAVIVSPAL